MPREKRSSRTHAEIPTTTQDRAPADLPPAPGTYSVQHDPDEPRSPAPRLLPWLLYPSRLLAGELAPWGASGPTLAGLQLYGWGRCAAGAGFYSRSLTPAPPAPGGGEGEGVSGWMDISPAPPLV